MRVERQKGCAATLQRLTLSAHLGNGQRPVANGSSVVFCRGRLLIICRRKTLNELIRATRLLVLTLTIVALIRLQTHRVDGWPVQYIRKVKADCPV